jgi:DnaJ-class molecular chaperone
MNPELEPEPTRPVRCPDCHGERRIKDHVGPGDRACGTCDGLGSITTEAADRRDSSAEAEWETKRNK